MKAYTIATRASECYGHGDYGVEEKICRIGSYGTGPFPPIFKDKAKALDYMMSLKYNFAPVLVEVEIQD